MRLLITDYVFHSGLRRVSASTQASGTAELTTSSAAHDQFMQAAKLGSPPVERKDEGAPVGLRNLGATCYVSL
jgi:ubiquitin C-terminal hydrolase